jgi:hypothetical protein
MTACPNCGFDRAHATKLVKSSAKDLVESLYLDADLLGWCQKNASAIDCGAELEQYKDRMRANGYKTNSGPVRDARAAFRTHMRNAVRYSSAKPPAPKRPVMQMAVRKEE